MPALNLRSDTPRPSSLRGNAVAAMVIIAVTAADAQVREDTPVDPLLLRAVQPLSEPLVRFLARRAEPLELPGQLLAQGNHASAREVIESICGDVHPGYHDEFEKANDLGSIALDEPLVANGGSVRVPACLYVNPRPTKTTVTVRPKESSWTIYNHLTGGGGSKPALERYFGKPFEKLKSIDVGEPLPVKHVTKAVPVVPKSCDKLDPTQCQESFWTDLKAAAGGAQAAAAVTLVTIDPQEATIIGGLPDHPADMASTTDNCKRASAPFDVPRVLLADGHSRAVAKSRHVHFGDDPAEVVVVDNGFLGARRGLAPADAFAGSHFPVDWFMTDAQHVLRHSVPYVGAPIEPLNDDSTPSDAQRGHGTHVTGLILGGPDFLNEWLANKRPPWARIAVLNVGRGTMKVVPQVQPFLKRLLNANESERIVSRIVNMSLAQADDMQSTVLDSYKVLFNNTASLNLYVVAAGNDKGANVRSPMRLPAALGGTDSPNVMTIAAIDGDGRIAPFSSIGATAVDLAAPGCRMHSWIDRTGPPVPLSGTSQAAPLVSFAASLLRSYVPGVSAKLLKARLVTSGDMLAPQEMGRTAFGVRLNVEKALLWFDDLLIETGEKGAEAAPTEDHAPAPMYLGKASSITKRHCPDEGGTPVDQLDDVWAIKRGTDGRLHLFTGRADRSLKARSCVMAITEGELVFEASHKLIDGRIEPVAPANRERRVPIKQISDLILAPDFSTL